MMISPAVRLAILSLTLVVGLLGCASAPPLRTVQHVELPRFMGDWFVIAHLPLRQERNAFDAIEHYELQENGRIRVRFTFRQGAHDGEPRELRLRAWVHDERTNAEWRVRPFWPLAMDYIILDLDPDYHVTVVGHPSRKYVWIMARERTIEAAVMAGIRARLEEQGYDLTNLRMVPQQAP